MNKSTQDLNLEAFNLIKQLSKNFSPKEIYLIFCLGQQITAFAINETVRTIFKEEDKENEK